jgi:hypothetical protein
MQGNLNRVYTPERVSCKDFLSLDFHIQNLKNSLVILTQID